MSDREIRRQVILDRLESVMTDAERYNDEAFDADEIDDATYWHLLAAAVRATIVMLNQLDA